MQSKTIQLNSLFDKWEQTVSEYKGKFVRDGIINENLYQIASTKILFITKEPNNPKEESGDFREWWKNEIKYAFSYRLAEWSYGLLNNFPEYDEVWKEKQTHNAIQQIAFLNIKKSGGGGNSELKRMSEHLKMNFDFLHKQIEIIDPEILILGLSWNKLRDGLFPNIKWEKSGYDILIGKHNKSKVIDYYHPSSRTAPAASYSLLQNIVLSDKFKSL
ncbi:MAG: hypothetical protein NTX93_01080 [Bacteroidia bacterium]|nr:hypothetical protein [Bacteroidia bacterium]